MERTPSALGRYLKSEGITVAAFARTIGKSHGAVWRWAFTERTPPIEIASLIERGTDGVVGLDAWLTHSQSVCQVARRGKSTKRVLNGRTPRKTPAIRRNRVGRSGAAR